MVSTLTEDIIIQSEPEQQDKNQIWEKSFKTCHILSQIFITPQFSTEIFHNVSDFDLKVLQRVRFCIEKKYNALDV